MGFEGSRYELVFGEVGPAIYQYGHGPRMDPAAHLLARARRAERGLSLHKRGIRDFVVLSQQ